MDKAVEYVKKSQDSPEGSNTKLKVVMEKTYLHEQVSYPNKYGQMQNPPKPKKGWII